MVLGLNSLADENPSEYVLHNGENSTKQEKAMYLKKVAAIVVEYVVDKNRNEYILRHVQQMEKSKTNAQRNSDGRYRGRARGCGKTFAHDGKLRRMHEASHNPPVDVSKHTPRLLVKNSSKNEEDRDDMLAYQKALLDYGMLILNFWDAIAGDGKRILRCWKFLLLYLKHQGTSATKYTLEALYIMFQVYALLSPRSAHRLIWNRTVKNKKGSANIPLDLMLEFYNRIIKEAVKN